MYIAVTIVHLVVTLGLILIVLLTRRMLRQTDE
jgi:hypothetical protein